MERIYQSLTDRLNESTVNYDLKKIRTAYEFASLAHEGQMRDSGEPYIIHPVSVAHILADYEPGTNAIIACILHDVIEDTKITYRELKKEFGSEVADLVEGVTKLENIPFSSKEEQQVENLRRMFLAMAKDIRVILIKLADRLHNMRTLESVTEEKQRMKALETMEVYAPLAHRLGMQKIKFELEDISIKFLDPTAYHQIQDFIKEKIPTGEKLLGNIKSKIEKKLKELKIEFYTESRFKHTYSIYRKLYKHNIELDQVYDIFAIRLIVNTVTECYTVLGMLHDVFTPLPGRFKDYIGTPKPNMYQSLHTTVMGSMGTPFEVQIRTWEMHKTAEFGIAAHWKYKRGIFGRDTHDEKLTWIRKLLEIQSNVNEPEDFMRALKIDMFTDEVFVFTPKGDVINLPSGSTPIDFAYAIHSAVGNKMIGAKVNGKIVEFSYALKNGEICEIITTSAVHGPNREWIKISRTGEARNKIRQWFKKEKREENVAFGKGEMDAELKRNNIKFTDEQKEELLAPVILKHGMQGLDDFYAAIGYGGVSISKIIPRLKDEYQKLNEIKEEEIISFDNDYSDGPGGGVIVENQKNCLVKFAKCCSPVPGDKIIGFITRGYGVSVHKRDCGNINAVSLSAPERLISVKWDISREDDFSANINITAQNRIGIIADITSALASMRVMIRSLNAREIRQYDIAVSLLINVRNAEHLQSVVARLKKIKDIDGVVRV